MVVEKLHVFYERDHVLHALVDSLSLRTKNQRVTIVDRLAALLQKDGLIIRRTEVMHAFRELEESGCGKLIIGRNTMKTRFEWAVDTIGLAVIAMQERVKPGPQIGTQVVDVANIQLVLPSTLSNDEVSRLIRAVRDVLGG